MDLKLTISGCDLKLKGMILKSTVHREDTRGPIYVSVDILKFVAWVLQIVAWVFQNRGSSGIDTCWCGTAYRPCLPIPRNPSLNLVEVDPVGCEQFLDGWRL